jgi:membrane-associated protease RseP (regulator of RpoE activity)
MIWYIILTFLLFFISILTHEIGHILTYRYYGGKKDMFSVHMKKGFLITFDYEYEKIWLTEEQNKKVILNGILFGGIPIFFGLINLPIVFGMTLIPLYVFGCWYDIKILKDM